MSLSCDALLFLLMMALISAICRWTASLLAVMMVLKPSGGPYWFTLPAWVFPTGNWRTVSGSRGALRLPSPLRTARDHFSVMQLKPFVRPLRDAVSPLLTAGYGLVCGNEDGATPDCRRSLSLPSPATPDGGCAIR